ncbi:unnamed protein product [Lactuca saligna]|uniref:GRF-type domain-containing protein n=1 Tax=Lactuca saligna TaxID=75948 RepID=A0AA36E433_LACSI|nr:unnamed protein product [Lactuca saligna]
MASSCSAKSIISSSSSNVSKTKKMVDDSYPCGCGFPSQIWTSTTKKNPGKKFRVCPNRLDPNTPNCSLWKWVDDDEGVRNTNKRDETEIKVDSIEVRISILEKDFNEHKGIAKKEYITLSKELTQMSRKLRFQKWFIIMIFVVFLVKLMM